MPRSQFTLFDGKVHVYKREDSDGKEGRHWQCATFLAGKNWRVSTKTDSYEVAKLFAEDWYLGLRGKARNGELKSGKTFKQAAEMFLLEYPVMTAGQRNEKYVDGKEEKVRVHLNPFFGNKVLSEITSGLISEPWQLRQISPVGTPLM